MGGCDGSEGRVEVCVYGLWGTVCGSSWGNNEAEVVCDQLGLPYIGNGLRNTEEAGNLDAAFFL